MAVSRVNLHSRLRLGKSSISRLRFQIEDGFKEIKLVVEQEFAEQEFDDWINFRLGVRLRGDYKVSDEYEKVNHM